MIGNDVEWSAFKLFFWSISASWQLVARPSGRNAYCGRSGTTGEYPKSATSKGRFPGWLSQITIK